jgi:hypothetical protein
MAFIKCEECGKSMSDSASCCPSCGSTQPKRKRSDALQGCGCALQGCGSLFFILIVLSWGISMCSRTETSRDSVDSKSSGLLKDFRPSAEFVPGVDGRSSEEVCNSTSENCQRWTFLAKQCEENIRQRDAGYVGQQAPYCTEMEVLRESVTGIDLSTAPGAYDF